MFHIDRYSSIEEYLFFFYKATARCLAYQAYLFLQSNDCLMLLANEPLTTSNRLVINGGFVTLNR